MLELHRNQDGQDHSEHGLENLRVSGIHQVAAYKGEGMKDQLPRRRPDDGRDEGGQQRDNQMVELRRSKRCPSVFVNRG
jgi:hypothetical protein